jgi:hypothetical protein
MALLNVKVGDKNFIVDAENKGTAKAFGRTKIDVTVTDATGDDVTAFISEGGSIEKLVPAPKKEKAEAAE